jgi:hypothetical protein
MSVKGTKNRPYDSQHVQSAVRLVLKCGGVLLIPILELDSQARHQTRKIF